MSVTGIKRFIRQSFKVHIREKKKEKGKETKRLKGKEKEKERKRNICVLELDIFMRLGVVICGACESLERGDSIYRWKWWPSLRKGDNHSQVGGIKHIERQPILKRKAHFIGEHGRSVHRWKGPKAWACALKLQFSLKVQFLISVFLFFCSTSVYIISIFLNLFPLPFNSNHITEWVF